MKNKEEKEIKYKQKHTFEPSGGFNELGKELCNCGLPLDIPSMHFEIIKNFKQKEEKQITKLKVEHWDGKTFIITNGGSELETIANKINEIIDYLNSKNQNEGEE